MMCDAELIQKIHEKLATVIAPDTNLDVETMGVIRDLRVEGTSGQVRLVFRPASPICPLAFSLADSIRDAIVSVNGVRTVVMRVEDFDKAEDLEDLLNPPEV